MSTQDNLTLTNRLGTWRVSRVHLIETLNGDQEQHCAWQACFGEAVIVAVECLWHINGLRYTGYHPQFDEIPEGEAAPEYEVWITRNDDGHIVRFTAEWRRLR